MGDNKATRSVVATPLWGASTARTRLLKRRTAPWLQRIGAFTLSKQRARSRGFTLAELLVSIGVLVVLVLLFTQLINNAATVTTLGYKQMDADSQAREVLDRMAIDFAQMVKRPDVDYYLKSSAGTAGDCGACGTQAGNDQAAFHTMVAGYYPTSPSPAPTYTDKSPASLISYRINSDNTSSSYSRMERMGKGLAWNGVSSSWTPVVFLPLTISENWPSAVSTTAADSTYEVIGPQVFRLEYYYLLKGQAVSGTTYNPIFSDTPWDTRISGHTDVSGMRDAAAIVADIAVIDPKSKVLLTDAQITSLAGQLGDYTSGMVPGQLRTQWQNTLDGITSLPRPAISGIRVYERYFYLSQ